MPIACDHSVAQHAGCPVGRVLPSRAIETPHCIDFILTADGVKAEAAGMVFTGKEPLPGGPGYVSDHVGLRASLFLAPSWPAPARSHEVGEPQPDSGHGSAGLKRP